MASDDTDQLTAPGAGAGIGKELSARLIARRDVIILMEQAAIDGLTAMTPRRWDPETKKWLQDPDYRVRTQTLFGLLEQMEGAPVQRVLVATPKPKPGESSAKVTKRIAASPALQAALQAKLSSARGKGAVIDAETATAKGGADEADLD